MTNIIMELALIYKWVNFVLFFGALVYFLRTPIKDFLADRKEALRRVIEETSRERLGIERRFQECRKRLSEAAAEMEGLKKDLMQEGALEKRNLIQKAHVFAKKIRDDAEKVGGQEMEKTKHLLRLKVLEHAVGLAKEGLKKTVDAADQERLVAWGIKHLEGLKL
ncbi:MAG: ATP synthase F0 subunit B [Deltaproteobacteria bacterium]|nr:ATP synthase F0 subunit B [Deltaproteobacteria bacterium]MDZ4224541.1 ATP synthase F0 subunit B [bacterium]